MARTLVVVVGAGASYGCRGPKWAYGYQPPLTKHLFDAGPDKDPILREYQGLQSFINQLRNLPESALFEDQLRRIRNSASDARRVNFLQVAPYLQQLLWECSERFSKQDPTAFDDLIGAIDEAGFDRVLFLTLNYDLLLEQALCRHFPRLRFEAFEDYIGFKKGWALVKYHGSVNWVRPLFEYPQSGPVLPYPEFLRTISVNFDQTAPMHHLNNREMMHSTMVIDNAQYYCYPVIAIPAADKPGAICPPRMCHLVEQIVPDMTHLLCIGFSCLDEHVLRVLGTTTKSVHAKIVDNSTDCAIEAWRRLTNHVKRFRRDDHGYHYVKGFHSFARDDSFFTFLQELD